MGLRKASRVGSGSCFPPAENVEISGLEVAHVHTELLVLPADGPEESLGLAESPHSWQVFRLPRNSDTNNVLEDLATVESAAAASRVGDRYAIPTPHVPPRNGRTASAGAVSQFTASLFPQQAQGASAEQRCLLHCALLQRPHAPSTGNNLPEHPTELWGIARRDSAANVNVVPKELSSPRDLRLNDALGILFLRRLTHESDRSRMRLAISLPTGERYALDSRSRTHRRA